MTASWGGYEEWSLKNRPSDAAPSRADISAEKWAQCASRFGPPRAQHVGRAGHDSYQALRRDYDDLLARQAATVATLERALADRDALEDERDAWRYKAAEADRRADFAETVHPSRLAAWLAGFASAFVCAGAWVALWRLIAGLIRLAHGG